MDSSTINSLFSEAIVSVAGLTDYIQELLEEDNQLHRVWVIGEVSSTNHHPKGMFFTLQDADAKATIQCVAWRRQLNKLVQLPAVGEQLIILGSLRVYPQRGQYQLNVWQALPAGEGLQALRSRQLRQRFEAEGLFDPQRKRPLPIHPETIAVVTSPQAAAWGDIKRTLKQRYPGLRVLFSPAQVQGEIAIASIVNAIDRVERDGRAKLLILARGGGASEDLACFNDERVVRAIAQCSIPVITGIGHQRDESLADLVADYSTHTPTAAAEQAVPELITLYAQHQQRRTTLYQAVTQITEASCHKLHHLRTRLRHLALDQQLHQEQNAIAFQHQRLLQVTSKRLSQGIQHCQLLKEKLHSLDPQKVLKRGYALLRTADGTIASSTENLAPGEELQIHLGEGQVKVKIIEIVDH